MKTEQSEYSVIDWNISFERWLTDFNALIKPQLSDMAYRYFSVSHVDTIELPPAIKAIKPRSESAVLNAFRIGQVTTDLYDEPIPHTWFVPRESRVHPEAVIPGKNDPNYTHKSQYIIRSILESIVLNCELYCSVGGDTHLLSKSQSSTPVGFIHELTDGIKFRSEIQVLHELMCFSVFMGRLLPWIGSEINLDRPARSAPKIFAMETIRALTSKCLKPPIFSNEWHERESALNGMRASLMTEINFEESEHRSNRRKRTFSRQPDPGSKPQGMV